MIHSIPTSSVAHPVITSDGSFLGYAHHEQEAIGLGMKTDFTPSGTYLINSGPAWERAIKDIHFPTRAVNAWLLRE